MSQLEVDKVIPQSGTTLTLGESGDTISIPSGATFTPTLTAPIVDEINDNNGNEEIIFTTTTSAVNELTIANAATGNAPEIAATGDDTDIDLKLTPKGAGNLVLDGIEFPNADGSANQVLQTNGSGVLSFATVGGGTQEFDAGTASLPSITTTGDTNTGIFFPSADTIAFTEGGTEAMRIDSSGRVGIGTTPTEKLDVAGDTVITGGSGNKALTINLSSAGGTVLKLNTFQDNTDNRNWSFRNRYDAFGMLQINRSTTQSGDSTTQVLTFNKDGNATFAGSVSKASGSFRIDHPLPSKKDTHKLVHSFVESPQANNIYRGKLNLINGTATVNLDTISGMTEGTFILLNRDIHCFTSNESGWSAVKGSVSGNILTITAQDNNCNDTISWLVIGERQDIHMYDTDWTDENGKVIVEPLKAPWETSSLSKENN